VAQIDNASYVFAQPTFNSAAAGIQVKNIRVAVNDVVPVAAQSFRRVDVMADGGTVLSPLGAVIPVALGPTMDQFHLEFEVLGGQFGLAEAIAPSSPPLPLADVPEPEVGVRSFSKINNTMSSLTGIPANNGNISNLYAQVRDSLPATGDILAFVSSNQVATQRMAVAYCGEIVSNNNTCDGFFGVANCSIVDADKATIADTVYDTIIGVNLLDQPDRTLATTELVAVMNDLCPGGCTGATAAESLQATCAAALSSAAVAIN